jgi:chromosome segregation ATPase
MHAGLDPVTATSLAVPLAGALLKLGSQAMQPWLEKQRRQNDLGTPMEQLVTTLREHSGEQDREITRLWEEMNRRGTQHDEEIESAREANEALRVEHARCTKDLADVQRQLGDQARQIGNLERALGVRERDRPQG